MAINLNHHNNSFSIGTSEAFRIDSSGRLKIPGDGTHSLAGTAALQIGETNQQGSKKGLSIADGEAITGGTGPWISLKHGPDGGTQRTHEIYSYLGDLVISADSNENMQLWTGGSRRITIDANGRLLVGTTTNSISSSQIAEFDGMTYFTNNSSSTGTIYIRNQYSNTGLAQLIIFTDGSGNRAGFGLNNSDQLEIHGHQGILFKAGGTVGGGSEKVRFTAGGVLCVGATAADGDEFLRVKNKLLVMNTANLGDAFVKIKAGESGGCVLEFEADEGDDYADLWRVQNAGDGLLGFRTKASGSWVQKFSVHNDKVMFSVDAKCEADNAIDLGASGARWRSLHLGTSARIGATGTTASTAGDDLVIEGSSDRGLSIISGTSSSANIYFGDSNDADIGRITYQHNDNALDFYTNAGSRSLRIASDGTINVTGNLEVGGTLNLTSDLYWDGDTDTNISNANTANWLRFTTGGQVVMDITDTHNVKIHDDHKLWFGASNDIQIYHATSNSTNYYYSPQGNVNHSFAVGASWTLETTGADKRIRCPGSGSSPRVELYYNGTEVLQTSTTGIDLVASKDLKVQTTGKITFGSGNATIKHTGTHWYFKSNTGDCYWDSTSAHHIRVADDESSIVCAANAGVDLYHNNSKKFGTTSSGIRVWTTWDSNAGIYVDVGSAQNGTAKVATFVTSHYGGERGSIGLTLSGTSYNTSSDYRMKENVVSLTGATSRIKNLKPKRFNFKEDDKTIDGFLAHEVSSVVPEAVTGEKDATEMQQLDYSKLATLTIAALQEAIAKIETLEAEVAALKSA